MSFPGMSFPGMAGNPPSRPRLLGMGLGLVTGPQPNAMRDLDLGAGGPKHWWTVPHVEGSYTSKVGRPQQSMMCVVDRCEELLEAVGDTGRYTGITPLAWAGVDNTGDTIAVLHNSFSAPTTSLRERYEYLDRLCSQIQSVLLQRQLGYSKSWSLVFVQVKKGVMPDIHWLRTSLHSLPRWLRKSLHRCIVVGPSHQMCMILTVLGATIPPKASAKIMQVPDLQGLYDMFEGHSGVNLADALPANLQLVGVSRGFSPAECVSVGIAKKEGNCTKIIKNVLMGLSVPKTSKRWAVLTDEWLLLYKTRDSLVPKCCYMLERGSVSIVADRKHTIRVDMFDDSKAVMTFENENEVIEWVEAISSVMETRNNQTKIFGAPIEQVISRFGGFNAKISVPHVVDLCCCELERRGLKEEGILRVGGSVQRIKTITGMLNIYWDLDLSLENIHNVSGVLKMFLREMKEPILPLELFEGIANLLDVESEGRQHVLYTVSTLIATIPECSRRTLRRVVNFAALVSANSEENRMTMRNVALVLGPSVIRRSTVPNSQDAGYMHESAAQILADTPLATKVIMLFIKDVDGIDFRLNEECYSCFFKRDLADNLHGRGLEQPNRYDAIYRLASANSALGPSQCSSSSSCSSQGMGALPTRSRKSLSAIVPGEISSNCSPLQMLAAMRALEKSGSHDADEFEKRKQDKNLDDLEGAGNQHRALSAPACTLGVIETGVLTRRRGSLVSLVNSRSSGGQSMVIETASSWEADDEVTPQRRREGGLSPFVLEDLRGTGTPSASRASSSNESFAPVSSNGSAQSRAGSVQSKEEVAQTVCVPPPRAHGGSGSFDSSAAPYSFARENSLTHGSFASARDHSDPLPANKRPNSEVMTVWRWDYQGLPEVVGSGASIDCNMWAQIGRSMRLAGDNCGALAAYMQASRMDPTNALHMVRVGFLCFCIGQEKHASKFFKAAEEIPTGSLMARGISENMVMITRGEQELANLSSLTLSGEGWGPSQVSSEGSSFTL